MRVCSVAGCPTIHDQPGSRCKAHETVAKQAHWAKTKAYNTRGHRIRFRIGVLQRDPLCVLCMAARSVVADHWPLGRDELVAAGRDPDDPAHGRGLCLTCDKKQSAQRQPGGWNAR